MGVYRPLRTGLFFYECFRLLLLAAFLAAADPEGQVYRGVFPYPAYLSLNALFPLMALFVWLRPREYGNYLSLYMAGKAITSFSVFAWRFFSPGSPVSFWDYSGLEDAVRGLILQNAGSVLSLADLVSVWAAWVLKSKLWKEAASGCSGKALRQAEGQGYPLESGGK